MGSLALLHSARRLSVVLSVLTIVLPQLGVNTTFYSAAAAAVTAAAAVIITTTTN